MTQNMKDNSRHVQENVDYSPDNNKLTKNEQKMVAV